MRPRTAACGGSTRAIPRVQVECGREPGLSGACEDWRTLVVVDAGAGRRYAVDLFEVEGGRTHDYFLHGDADDAGDARRPM